MGRRHLIHLKPVALTSALALAGVAAAFAAAATGLRWSPLATGATEPSGSQAPNGHLALTRRQEQGWITRIVAAQRPRVTGVDFKSRAVVATFLDGQPCASDTKVTAVTRAAGTLTVHIVFTRPPVGVATCIRTSTAYFVLTIPRSAFGGSAPVRVHVDARARA
jgi:hypothetical protein